MPGSAAKAASATVRPLINAGDGPGQHPTQALLDVYTIQKEIGRLDNIKVGLVGDLANGRTVRSLAYLLSKFKNVQLFFIAPDVRTCFGHRYAHSGFGEFTRLTRLTLASGCAHGR